MKTKSGMLRGFTLVELLVVIVIIAALAGLTAPMILKQARKADFAEATSNARQIGMALFAFQAEYSSYPDSTTAGEVDNTGNYAIAGTEANNYFAQLFAAGMTESEAMFYAKVAGSKKPDGNVTGAAALAAGECGFGYVLNGTTGLTTSGNPSRIVAMCPLTLTSAGASSADRQDAATGDFDSEAFDKKAILLRIDNSVTPAPIKSGAAMSSTKADAVDLFAPGDTSIWGATVTTPTIVRPIPKGTE